MQKQKVKPKQRSPKKMSGTPVREKETKSGVNPVDGKISTYFLNILKNRTDLLKIRSNEEIYLQWLKDNPGHTEIPRIVAQTLANVKNKLRKELKIQHKSVDSSPANLPGSNTIGSGLENLEQMIDDCLHVARAAGREDFEKIIYHLRYARNQIIKHLEQ